MANAFSQFLVGSPAKVKQLQRFTGPQQGALNQILGMGLQGLQNPTQGFEPIRQRAVSQFNQQTVPGLAERFTGGTGGALSSPAFAAQLGQAGAGLSEGLAALESQYGLQNRAQLMQLLGMGLEPQFEYASQGAEPGFLQNILGIGGQYAPLALAALVGRGGDNTWGSNFARLLGNQGGLR